jgi:hypothetical protein
MVSSCAPRPRGATEGEDLEDGTAQRDRAERGAFVPAAADADVADRRAVESQEALNTRGRFPHRTNGAPRNVWWVNRRGVRRNPA